MLEVEGQGTEEDRVLRVRGVVDLESSPRLWSALEQALGGTRRLRLHLGEVSYIDSSGIATLVKGLKYAQRLSVAYAILEPSGQVLSVIKLAQLDRLFAIEKAE